MNLKKKARERLKSDIGIAHRKRRPVDVEPVFGMLKQNRGFRRFLLRGLDKVSIEFGLLALAHNLKKLTEKPSGKKLFPKSELLFPGSPTQITLQSLIQRYITPLAFTF